jgi:hypothetical protein
MADLSDTLVVVPKAPTEGQVATLLEALAVSARRPVWRRLICR